LAAAPFQIRGGANRKIFRYKWITFFAERGLLRTLDERDGEFKTASRAEFLLRADAIRQSRDRSTCPKEKAEMQKCVEDMILTCQQADAQGDPFKPGVMRQMKHHNRYMGGLVPRSPIWTPGS
jgi:hypothetical protein